jgi:DNA helicase-2/ATP-dependent DNA helicase PcrA
MFNPSPQQSAIFDSIRLGSSGPSLIVDAKAGSGKTTTIVEGLKHIPTDGILKPATTFLAFNKSIAETLKSRCPSWVQCSTFNALGFRALKNSGIIPKDNWKIVDSGKCRKLVWNACDRNDPDTNQIIKLVSLAKSVPVASPSYEQLQQQIIHHNLDIENVERAIQVVQAVIKRSNEDLDTIDFDDQLYLAVIMDARFDKQDWVFVDEAQDTNDIQLEILSRMMKTTPPSHPVFDVLSRLIAVGDPHQAIYGFRGANSDSMQRIAKRFKCETLPLSVSYRCSKAVVTEAQKYLKPVV